MTDHNCPKDRLPMLIQDELSPQESGHILAHLEECSSCQRELETLTADATWWTRTTRALSGVAVDDRSQLPSPDQSFCSVDALLEGDRPGDPPAASSQAISALLDPPVHPEMLGRLDEFDIEEMIGQGGMGIVFRGFDRSLNRPVAVKVMAPHLGANGVARKRFAREAEAAAAVVHPHVVPIYRVNSSAKRPYIAMALIDGRSLQDYISQNGPLETKDVVRISIQIAAGLAAAHRQGLIHRDIKPANILMEKDVRRVMITDFGLARAIDDVAMTQSGCLAGTPHYMSPEQVRGVDIDHRSDLFSLGSVMYFIATGQEPFHAESAFAVLNKITHDDPSPPRSINAEIPETLDRIIGRLLEKVPADRIQSADELQHLLTQYLAHLQAPQRHAQPRVKGTRSKRINVLKRFCWAIEAVVFFFAIWWTVFFTPVSPPESNEHKNADMLNSREGSEHYEPEHNEEGGREELAHPDSHN